MSHFLVDVPSDDSHNTPSAAAQWRQSASSEVLLGAAAPTLPAVKDAISAALGGAARVSTVGGLDGTSTGLGDESAVITEFRGVRVTTRTSADGLNAEMAAEGEQYCGAIAFPVDHPSFQGPLNAARGIAVWNNNAAVLLGTVARIRSVAEVVAPAEDGPVPGAPVGTDPYLDALREELALATVTAILATVGCDPLGVWVPLAGITLPAGVYRDTVARAPLPIPALVGVRVGIYTDDTAPTDAATPPHTLTFGFTTGMFRFGRADKEMNNRPTPPGETLGAMFDVLAFELGTATIIEPGTPVDLRDGRVFDVDVIQSPITGWNLLHLTQQGLQHTS